MSMCRVKAGSKPSAWNLLQSKALSAQPEAPAQVVILRVQFKLTHTGCRISMDKETRDSMGYVIARGEVANLLLVFITPPKVLLLVGSVGA